MSNFYVPGHSYHYLGINGIYSHVGYVQQSTAVELMAAHADLNADYAGPAMPADVQYLGEMAMMSLAFSRYDESVINLLKARIRNGFPRVGWVGVDRVADGGGEPGVLVGLPLLVRD